MGARQQEYFNPTSGNWITTYQTGRLPSQKSLDSHLLHIVLPDSDSLRVCAAGPDTIRYVLNLPANLSRMALGADGKGRAANHWPEPECESPAERLLSGAVSPGTLFVTGR